MSSVSLVLSPQKYQRMLDLKGILQNKILEDKREWIPFSQFMYTSLYNEPGGYYTSANSIFGQAGDFITAYSSTYFCQIIAQYLLKLCVQLKTTHIVELGPGSGELARAVLAVASQMQLSIRYSLIEISSHLQFVQRENLEQVELLRDHQVEWFKVMPEGVEAVVFANEFFDSLPVELISWHDRDIWIRGVSLNQHKNFVWHERPLRFYDSSFFEMAQHMEIIHGCKNYHTEIHPIAEKTLEYCLSAIDKGVFLIIDYGFNMHEYYHAQRDMGTLMCHLNHSMMTNPLLFPGVQDITAHINFTGLAITSQDLGCSPVGYWSLASFLLGIGILDLLDGQVITTEKDAKEHAFIQTLLSPAEMGDLFKVLLLQKNIDKELVKPNGSILYKL